MESEAILEIFIQKSCINCYTLRPAIFRDVIIIWNDNKKHGLFGKKNYLA